MPRRRWHNGTRAALAPWAALPSSAPMPDAPKPDPSLQSEAKRLADAARDRASDAVEELKLASNQVVDKVREAIEDANVKRVTIQRDGKTLLEIPLTVGVGAGAAALLMSPALAAVGALAALVSDVTVMIEREDGGQGGAAQDHVANVNDPETDLSGDKTVGKPSAE